MTDTRGVADLRGFADLVAGDQISGGRAYQEDDFRITGFPNGDLDGCDLLLVLADGMGGHRGGAQASRLAVSTFVNTFRPATGGVALRLRASLDAANVEVGRRAAEGTCYAGMGCTLVACVVTDDARAHWISVGDSPLWRLCAAGDRGDAGMDLLHAVEARDKPSQDNATAVVYRHIAVAAVRRRFERLTAPTKRMVQRR